MSSEDEVHREEELDMSLEDELRREEELDLSSNDVVTKYKEAAEILNNALRLVVFECKPKAKIVDLCEKGDAFIREQTHNVYQNAKRKIERGIAFPTCVSVNNTVCHFSPLATDEAVLEENDMAKIEMGCHIDGFIAVVAHTHVITNGPVTGRAADVLAAANTSAEVAMRLVRPGKKNKDVTEAIQKVAAAYDCKIVEGVLSHQLKQFVIDGNIVTPSVSNADTMVDDTEFEENEVYAIDIVTSTGEGKPKLLDENQTTIYKRSVDNNYHLKMNVPSFIFSEINQKFPIMPFTAMALGEKYAHLGLVECMNYDLLQPYPVLYEKPGDLVAHIKFTVLLMPNGSEKITSQPLQDLQPTKSIEDNAEIKAWLALGTKSKKDGGKKEGRSSSCPHLGHFFRLHDGISWCHGKLLIRSSRGAAPYKKKLACRSQNRVEYGSFSDDDDASDVTVLDPSDNGKSLHQMKKEIKEIWVDWNCKEAKRTSSLAAKGITEGMKSRSRGSSTPAKGSGKEAMDYLQFKMQAYRKDFGNCFPQTSLGKFVCTVPKGQAINSEDEDVENAVSLGIADSKTIASTSTAATGNACFQFVDLCLVTGYFDPANILLKTDDCLIFSGLHPDHGQVAIYLFFRPNSAQVQLYETVNARNSKGDQKASLLLGTCSEDLDFLSLVYKCPFRGLLPLFSDGT